MPTADNSERNATSTTPVTPVHHNYGAHGFQNDYQITTEGRVSQLYYDTWLQGFNANPLYAAAYAKYGDKFKRLIFDAEQHNQDENVVIQRLLNEGITFAGLKVRAPGGGGRGGGGGGPTKAQQIAAAEAAIRNMTGTMGYTTFPESSIKALATTVVQQNWSNEQLTDYLVKGATGDWGQLTSGTLSAGVDRVKELAGKQLISVSDDTARSWAARLVSGELDENGLQSMLQAQAKARFGWAADTIDKGISMSDLLAPSRDRIAQELEIAPNAVNLSDPKYMSMVTVTDPKTGPRIATDAEVVRNARKDEQWKSTRTASAMASSVGVMLRRYVEGR